MGALLADDNIHRDNRCRRIAADLLDRGWSVCDGFADAPLVAALAAEAEALRAEGAFRHAGVGAGRRVRPDIRGDRIRWIDPATAAPAQASYLAGLEALRRRINEALFLGLFEFEGHFALYPPGSFYARHFDRVHGDRHRLVTCILYLNRDWREADGGALRFFPDSDDDPVYTDILPEAGRLVVFLTERFAHEVRPAGRARLSLTGWFRMRPLPAGR